MAAAGLVEADQEGLGPISDLSDGPLTVGTGVNGSAVPDEADEVLADDAGLVRTGRPDKTAPKTPSRPSSPQSTTPYPAPVASTSTSTPSPSSSSKPSAAPAITSPAPRKIAVLRRPSVPVGAEKEAAERAERNSVDEVTRHAAKLSLSVPADSPSTDELDMVDGERPPLDKVLRDGLQNPRDRLLLLRAEVEMERFVANSSVTRLPLAPPHFQPGLNSYQRLLIHRLADMFGITREVEAAPPTMWNAGMINPATGQPQGVVVLVKGEATTIPLHKLATYVPAPDPAPSASPATPVSATPDHGPARAPSPSASATDSLTAISSSSAPPTPAPLPVFKILPRANVSRTASSASSSVVGEEDGGSSASGGTNAKGKGRRDLTLEEREAAYKEARDRIFNAPEADRSTIANTSAGSSVAGEDSASVRSLGVGITRPSSAGSTFSRSSAALSVSGSRPPPSIASESSSSIRSGYLGYYQPPASFQGPGGPYGAVPSLRPLAPSFDHATGNWTYAQPQPEYTYGGRPPYGQPGPGAQIPPPPPPPAPYGYPSANPAYAPQQPVYGDALPLPPLPQHQPPPAWSRGLPSPALSSSSGGSFPPQSFYPAALPQPLQQTPPATASNDPGYLMRFPEGAVVTPGGSVVGPPTPFSSVVSTGGDSLRSGSSLSLASSASRGTRGATAGSSGPPSLRRLSQSTTHSIGSISAVSSAPVSEDAAQRRSPSDAEEPSPEASLGGRSEEGSSRTGASTPASEGRKRDRQPTIVGERSPAADGDEGAKGKAVLHPSLPPKPAWVATRRPPEPTAPAVSTSPSHANSSQPVPPPPPPPFASSTYSASQPTATQRPPLSFAAAAGPSLVHPSAYPPVRPPPVPGAWNAAASQVSHPSGGGMPSFANPGEYPALCQQPPSRTTVAPPPPPPQPYYPPAQGPSASAYPSWPSHAATGPPPARHGLPHVPSQPFVDDLMNMPDIRRPPPKSTQLFDPSKPMRRGGSGAGKSRG
ncbi:R3H domain containing protein [Rhodotorula toruloides]|uniref:R3H domain containing protein n=1 Tax=Rhodotorula toruloides TaxID=5286 RepID=A0A511KNV2_RHOTO|nr:R3H domain containing protein [Rhodotorula toruloides]